MDVLRRTLWALSTGAGAGVAALALDQLAALATLGYPVPIGLRFVLAYVGLGVVCGLLAGLVGRWAWRDAPAAAGIFAPALALMYTPAIFERVHTALAFRAGQPAAYAAAALATAGYGLWIFLLRRLAGPRAEGLAPLLGAVTAAAGLAVNRNLFDYPLEPRALAADAAILAAGALLAWTARAAGTRRVLACLTALVLGAAALAVLEGWRPTEQGTSGPRRPNLVMVVVDTLRQDVFEAVLEETAEGRAFRDAMGGAAWFSQAIAAAPWTVPSIGTLMTGLHPREHGFRASGVGDPSRPLTPLPDSVPTLAEHLQRHGYWTEAIGTNPLLQPISGIARGFARYEVLSGPTVTLPPLTVLARIGLVEKVYYQQASAVRRRLAQRLGSMAAAGRPVFLWLHLLEPHAPLQRHRNLTPDPGADALAPLNRLYRDEVRYALVELVRMIELLRDRGLWDETVMVVVSDHGEMFPSDNHDNGARDLGKKTPKLYGHGHALYDELVRVPLVVRPAGGLPEHRSIDVLTSHADVFDTLADLLELDLSPPGRDRLSLAPWLKSRPPRRPRRGRTYALIGATQHGPEQRGMRTPKLKLIEYPGRRRRNELYFIAADPREQHNVARKRKKELKRARRRLESRWSRLGEPPEARPPAALDAETLEKLKALGYVP